MIIEMIGVFFNKKEMYFKILFVCKEGLIRFDASDIHVHFVLTDAIPLYIVNWMWFTAASNTTK